MSSLRQLRSAASSARKQARKTCTLALKEGRAVANARAAMIKAAELRKAREACEAAERAAQAVVRAYTSKRPAETPARARSRARRRERIELTRRDAIARVVEERNVPERVAELAVRRAERTVRTKEPRMRWEVVGERAPEFLDDAWRQYERESARIQPVGDPVRVPRKRASSAACSASSSRKKAAKKKTARRRGARIQPVGAPVIIIDETDVPF